MSSFEPSRSAHCELRTPFLEVTSDMPCRYTSSAHLHVRAFNTSAAYNPKDITSFTFVPDTSAASFAPSRSAHYELIMPFLEVPSDMPCRHTRSARPHVSLFDTSAAYNPTDITSFTFVPGTSVASSTAAQTDLHVLRTIVSQPVVAEKRPCRHATRSRRACTRFR